MRSDRQFSRLHHLINHRRDPQYDQSDGDHLATPQRQQIATTSAAKARTVTAAASGLI